MNPYQLFGCTCSRVTRRAFFTGDSPNFKRADLSKFEKKTFPSNASDIHSRQLQDAYSTDDNYYINGNYKHAPVYINTLSW